MHKILRVVLIAPSLLFLAMGIGLLGAPAFVSPKLGMPVLSGVGLSTQIADMASFFLTLGCCMAIGLATGNRTWLLPPIMLLGFAAVGRVLAWLLHDAALAWDMILVEAVVAGLMGLLVQPRKR
jgi:hypothetical protein